MFIDSTEITKNNRIDIFYIYISYLHLGIWFNTYGHKYYSCPILVLLLYIKMRWRKNSSVNITKVPIKPRPIKSLFKNTYELLAYYYNSKLYMRL